MGTGVRPEQGEFRNRQGLPGTGACDECLWLSNSIVCFRYLHLNWQDWTKKDGFERSAPVMSYPNNDFGLYDMAGNVWEWTSDWYNTNYYKSLKDSIVINPKGPRSAYNKNNPYAKEKVIKGGSFLCSASYCASYRISARMATSPDSGMEHLGFRTVLSAVKTRKSSIYHSKKK